MPKHNGNKVRTKKRNKNKHQKQYNCLECLDTGIIVKDVEEECPYCNR
jgi:hypothetical protein